CARDVGSAWSYHNSFYVW
nr:immunoglobulin heavy chain junction region [Macaca mulatta]MOX93057.1 immunoglobulin heavy chain junction region [Macaca mulatta]MOX93068.1 immunoglobulin heavy chain junction region [Macaca mulatta]MOX93476.1 immunoglobulin heavy chain junction region [Macaca mulatta]MOX93604.1 immunoglobulin heavy chain junction region [Macaca mulatta]